MKRRGFLALSAVSALALLSGCGGSDSNTNGMGNGNNGNGANGMGGSQGSTLPSGGIKTKSLPIPALLSGDDRGGVKHYDLSLQKAQHDFFNATKTDTFGINATYLGPTLLMQNGDEVSVNYSNNLGELVTMHGHGMHLPPSMDGTPHQPITAGTTWSARYKVNQKACTNWYHPHTMDKTAEHVYKGLAGLIMIEDAKSKGLDLPKRYGEDDIPLVLQDRFFNNGQLDYNPSRMQVMRGYVGDVFMANGAIDATLDVEAKEIRFRILNGSNSSIYNLGFSDGRSFKQIATDNAFLEAPVSLTRLRLSPAERAEIVVDLSSALNQTIEFRDYQHNKTFFTINVNKTATTTTTLPNSLTTLEKLDPALAVRTRQFTLDGSMGSFQINGKSMDVNRIDESVPLGDIEIWEVTNTMMVDHNFHIHATHFMPIERNGSAANVAANEKGYKDVIFVPANESVKLIVQMKDYADNSVPYMYHCHFLEHEDAGMMGQFVVTS